MEKRTQKIFLAFTFGWSFIFWGISIYLSIKGNTMIPESTNVLKSIIDNTLSGNLLTIVILNTLAGYGPLLGAILVYTYDSNARKYFKNRFKLRTPIKYFLQIIALFIIITTIPAIPLIISRGLSTSVSLSLLGFLLLFFVYQLITAGTEEIGWRGYLLPSFLKKKTPWNASVYIGVIWALWHTPIILYVFYAQGLTLYQIILSFAGYIAGTIAMSVVHTYYYLKSENILLNVFIHAVANTIPMFVGIMASSSYEVSVAVQVLLWVFVFYITKKNKDLFDTVQDLSM